MDTVRNKSPRSSSGSPSPPSPWPPFLRFLPEYRILQCLACGRCYVKKNYRRHLTRIHHLSELAHKAIFTWVEQQDFTVHEADVPLPRFGSHPISGLPQLDGFTCASVDCNFLTCSEEVFARHCSKEHGKRFGGTIDDTYRVVLQTFFSKSPRYFRVVNLIPTISTPPIDTVNPTTDARRDLDYRYQLALNDGSQEIRTSQAQHISEITPWLRVTCFHVHKQAIGDVDDFRDVLRLPRRETDLSLSLICESVNRLFRRGLDRVQDDSTGKRLHRLDAQHLNSFQAGVVSQDPLQRLDREHSIRSYSRLFQQLVCYFFRIEDDAFGHSIFKATDRQRRSSVDVMEEAMRQAQALETDHQTESGTSDEDIRGHTGPRQRAIQVSQDERVTQQNEHRLDQLTQAFCLSLVQHRLDDSSFDNAILSFCAVLAWDSSRSVWRKDIGNYRSSLSQLVYICQLLVLLHCDELVKDGRYSSLHDAIISQRDLWLQNASRGPVGDIQAWRLYARSIASDTVGLAQIRWHQDGLTLAYRDINYKVSYLHDEMVFCLDKARRILRQDLALNLSNIPVYALGELVDDWDNIEPRRSFVDDLRNADCLNGGKNWLFDQILSSPTLANSVLQKDNDSRWGVRPDFAQQYEMAVQHFLEVMLSVLHKGSGQPARRPEMLGLRWQNTSYDKRNLFLHDGYVLFILTYHKSQSQSHASRYPVRFLLPEAGELLVRFLVLIQPFRRWVSQETRIPRRVTEYLWSDSNGVWSDDRMTRLIQRNSLLSIGVSTHVQAWRQIAVGIAIKFFSGTGYQADLDRCGDVDDDDQGRPLHGSTGDMPEVFHHQATHAPRTGNQVYGGTVNFKDGLTDAGLQQYLQASQMWHRLCHTPPSPSSRRLSVRSTPSRPLQSSTSIATPRSTVSPLVPRTSSKHRPASLIYNTPLPKRLAVRHTPQRHRRRWSTGDALVALRSLFGDEATYRTPAQAQMVEQIVSGRGEVVAALATSEGKSLAFMLPARLPQAGTTVVILPLVVLKQEMFRRCTQLGLSFAVWDRHGDHIRYDGCPLVFVSAETAVLTPFRSFITGLDAREGLDRVVVDESHLILSASDYRPKLKLIKYLRALRCQFVFLSATLPPLLMPTFSQRLLLFDPAMIRSDHTFRRDVQYAVVFTQSNPELSFVQLAIHGIQNTLTLPTIGGDPTARVIIYTTTRERASEIAAALNVDVYFSDSGTVDEKATVLTRWIDGSHRTVVATSAFGMGVDYPRVAAVLHVGAPTNAIDFAQEVGRLGRDGRGGQSTVILPPKSLTAHSSLETEALLPVTQQVMNSYVRLPRCHAAVLSWFLDGSPWYCDSEDPSRRCSRCRRLGLRSNEDDPEDGPPWLGLKQQKQLALDNGLAPPSDIDSEDHVSSDDEYPGPEVLRQHVRDEARDRERYVRLLEDVAGCCMICRLLGTSELGTNEIWHTLAQCRHRRKGDFFTAKKAAIKAGQQHRGWLAAYAACYSCGNPQEVCHIQGSGECRFRDIVFPTSWAFFHTVLPFTRSVEQWTGRVFDTEAAWMRWLGLEREVYGMRAINAMWITDQVLQELGPL